MGEGRPTLNELLERPERVALLSARACQELLEAYAAMLPLLIAGVLKEIKPAPSSERVLSRAEAAERMNVSEDWLRKHGASLPFYVGSGRFLESGLNEYLRRQTRK